MYNYLATDIFQNGKRFINLPKNTLYFFKSETWWCYIGSKFTVVLLKIYCPGHLSICMWNLRVFLDDALGCHCPFVLCLVPQDCIRVGFCHRASSWDDGGTTWRFSSCGGILEFRRAIQSSSCVGPGKSYLPFEFQGRAGDCSRVTSGQNRPHLGLCPGLNARP